MFFLASFMDKRALNVVATGRIVISLILRHVDVVELPPTGSFEILKQRFQSEVSINKQLASGLQG